jgi:imidazolonepropionase-like amidohydrolase
MKYFKLALLALIFTGIAHAETTAIVGATVHTVGPRGTLENATVVIEDGRIVAVGDNMKAPDGATVVDAAGKIVTPGLFTPIGQLGLVEVGLSAGPDDSGQIGDQFAASFDVADAFNRRSTLIAINRIEGVTRAVISPTSAGMDDNGNISHVFDGLASVVNLGDGMASIDRRGVAMVVNLGENGVDFAGGSRAAALLIVRQALDEARDYRDHGDAHERGQHSDYNNSVADLQALQGVLSRDVPLLTYVDRASDIEVLLSLAHEYGIRAIIAGGAEAWMVADHLAAANIPVILAPTANLPSSFDSLNASLKSAAILAAAGVKIAFADGEITHNPRNITQWAGIATAEGLPWDDALRAITLSPAEIYGVADQVGSIEVGKDADIVIWPGDPLELTNYAEQVFIKGESVPMVSRQTMLRDRYLDTDDKRPPAYRN